MKKQNVGLLEDRLKEYRYAHGMMTQKQAAILLGIGERTIRRAESGEPLSERTVYKLEKFLKGQEVTA